MKMVIQIEIFRSRLKPGNLADDQIKNYGTSSKEDDERF